ncbi:hypothetical protein UCD39_27165 [Nitrospirillum sp. BR 11752]|uniref:hypothetical protein n=1 Tax=Nitrospirillum sp. BR 11752 TaxID=3104293 RepID=UPI002EA98F76|nr:hypothetical protein [Nitrospirillum sp. BR 11752]
MPFLLGMTIIAQSLLPRRASERHESPAFGWAEGGEEIEIMVRWLMGTAAGPSVLQGILAFQITGSPVSALLALAAPILRAGLRYKEAHHA